VPRHKSWALGRRQLRLNIARAKALGMSATVPTLGGGIVLTFDSVTFDAPIDPKVFEVK